MTKEEAINKLRELHDAVKAHPYWNVFDHAMFRNEVYRMLRQMMNLVSDMRYKIEGVNTDTPFFALHKHIFHDFSALLGRIEYDKDVENSHYFKNFYIITLQSYIQFIHFFIEGIDDADVLVVYMPNRVYGTTGLNKIVPYYHNEIANDEGYKFYNKIGWHSVKEIKESEADELITRYSNWQNSPKLSDTLRELYHNYVKDIKEGTNFIFKVVPDLF